MSDLPYGPPVRVSPLIRFGRWSLLTVGIAYGAFHQNRLSRKEAKFREIQAKEKVIKDAKLKEEKAIAAAAEIKALEEMVSGPKK
ncbi:ATP synthase subunit e, mitochondrial [Hyposmocoma kahamanoa]|uniref:ATP synthase subunit e, mitochondrial n=1 Tax=Hyposmocoma kahamanoa TaxID=1477025 RepID=UPI000E6D973B|nr:ATP synthase subunit e, mitochondrial [Hyposmocoma kahamanoa]